MQPGLVTGAAMAVVAAGLLTWGPVSVVGAEPLIEALASGQVSAEARLERLDGPLADPVASIELQNTTEAPVAIRIDRPVVLVPGEPVPGEKPSQQAVWAGPQAGRGGIVGQQIVRLASGQIATVHLPVLKTVRDRIRVDDTRYQILPVADWSDDHRLHRLAAVLAERGAAAGTAQAALWRILLDEPFWKLRATAARAGGRQSADRLIFNAQEITLAEALVDEVSRDAGTETSGCPARLWLEVVDRADQPRWASQFRKLAVRSGFCGLPVSEGDPNRVEPTSPTHLTLAIRCQVELLRPEGEFQSRTTLMAFDGAKFEAIARLTASLLAKPPTRRPKALEPAAALAALETQLLAQLLRVELPKPTEDSADVPTARLVNDFPLTLHSLRLRRGQAMDAEELTLHNLAVGPGRVLRLPPLESAQQWNVIQVRWGY